jgi:hypothetical protein
MRGGPQPTIKDFIKHHLNEQRGNTTTTTTAAPVVTTTTTLPANVVSPPFPKCIGGIPGVYKSGDNAIFRDGDGTQYVLNLDATYYNSKGAKGKWKCDSDVQLHFTPSDVLDQQQGLGTFPDCVTGLKKANDYYYGTAMDDQNNQYTVMYYSTPKTSSDGIQGYRAGIVPKGGNKPSNGVYFCSGDEIVIGSWDGNVKLTAKAAESKQSTGDAEAELEGVNQYNVGGLELYYGDNNVNYPVLDNAVKTVKRYIENKYRSNYFNFFLEMLGKMKDFASAYNRPKDVSFIERQIADIQKIGQGVVDVINNQTAKIGQVRWDPFSDPDQLDDSVYKPAINLKGKFPWDKAQQDVLVYQLTDELMSRTDMQNTELQQAQYMKNFELTKENCQTELATLLKYARREDLTRGWLSGKSKTVNVGQGFDPEKMKTTKHRVSLCSDGNQYGNREKDALTWLAAQDTPTKYRVNFGASSPADQPK